MRFTKIILPTNNRRSIVLDYPSYTDTENWNSILNDKHSCSPVSLCDLIGKYLVENHCMGHVAVYDFNGNNIYTYKYLVKQHAYTLCDVQTTQLSSQLMETLSTIQHNQFIPLCFHYEDEKYHYETIYNSFSLKTSNDHTQELNLGEINKLVEQALPQSPESVDWLFVLDNNISPLILYRLQQLYNKTPKPFEEKLAKHGESIPFYEFEFAENNKKIAAYSLSGNMEDKRQTLTIPMLLGVLNANYHAGLSVREIISDPNATYQTNDNIAYQRIELIQLCDAWGNLIIRTKNINGQEAVIYTHPEKHSAK